MLDISQGRHAVDSLTVDPPLYPPSVKPPKTPLPLPLFLLNFVRNPLSTLPEAVYREPIHTYASRGNRVAWITDPALIRDVMLDRRDLFHKTPLERQVLGPLLGSGILIAEGAEWKWQRQVVAPAFRPSELTGYVPAMVRAAEDQVDAWRRVRNPVRMIDQDMTAVTFRIICDTIIPSDADVSRTIGGAGDNYLGPISWPIAYAMVGFPDWLPFPGQGRMARAEQEMRAAVTALVRAREAAPAGQDDLLAKLLAARDADGRPMPVPQLVDNLITFLAAGHATTAMALTWILYLLASAPHWASRVRDEVAAVAGSAPLQAQHIDQLAITTRVVKEAMRLYPPAPVMTRIAMQDVELGERSITKNTMIVVPIWAVHRHHRLWDDPARFDPDRFLPEVEAARPRYQYLPFGAGPRICIGMAFAMMEAVALTATFIRSTDFQRVAGPEPVPISRVTLRPRGGLTLIARPRA
jgi:cytochrome P450